MSCGGLVLAAGLGRRLGGLPKASVFFEGKTLLERAVTNLQEAGCTPVVAVIPPLQDPRPPRYPQREAVVFVPNPEPEKGLGFSLALGAREICSTGGAQGTLVVLVDQILLDSASLAPFLVASEAGRRVVACRYGPEPEAWGPPVVLPRYLLERLLDHSGDRGARDLLEGEAQAGRLLWLHLPEAGCDWDEGPLPRPFRR